MFCVGDSPIMLTANTTLVNKIKPSGIIPIKAATTPTIASNPDG